MACLSVEKLNFTWQSCPVWVKGIWIIKPGPTLFVGVFLTLVQCGDRYFKARLEVDCIYEKRWPNMGDLKKTPSEHIG
jgi:hypothetical protein